MNDIILVTAEWEDMTYPNGSGVYVVGYSSYSREVFDLVADFYAANHLRREGEDTEWFYCDRAPYDRRYKGYYRVRFRFQVYAEGVVGPVMEEWNTDKEYLRGELSAALKDAGEYLNKASEVEKLL